jgi:uncharacterized membrane protein
VHHAIDATLARIPLIGKIYSAVGQIVDLFGKKDPGGIDKFGGVGQIRIGESSMLGLLTSPESFSMPDGRKYFLVFVPNSPIPATGFNILVPVENFFKLDLPMEELAKLLMSLGLLGPQVLGSRNRKDE